MLTDRLSPAIMLGLGLWVGGLWLSECFVKVAVPPPECTQQHAFHPLVVPVPSPTLLTCASEVTLAAVQDQERLGARYVGHDDAGNWAAGEPLSSWVLRLLAVGGEGGASSVSVQHSKYCHQNVVACLQVPVALDSHHFCSNCGKHVAEARLM